MEDARTRRSFRWDARFAFSLYVAVALLYAGPGLLPGRVLLPLDLVADIGAWKPDPAARAPVSNHLLSDAVLQYHPWDVQVRRAIAEGRIPWTNPYAGEGVALFANPQTALLSPFTWPRLLFGERGWALCVLFKLLVAGLGLRRLAARLGAGPRAAAFSGLVYMLSGYSILWGLAPPANVFAFLPWLAEAAHRLLFDPSRRAATAVVLFAALATAGGHPETLAFGAAALAVFLLLESGAEASRTAPGGRATLLTVLAALFGFLLLAVELVPFFRVLEAGRIVDVRSASHPGGMRLFAVAGEILPGFLGSPLAGEIDLSGAFFGSENMNMRSEGFVGFVTLVAILLALPRLSGAFRRGLVVGSAALAVAWRVPPLGWLWAKAPLLSLFAPEYAAAVFVLFASLAAGPAFEILGGVPKGARRAAGLLVVGGTLLAGAGLLAALPAARPAISGAAHSAIARLRERGHLKLDPRVYEERLDGYLEDGRTMVLRRLVLPGAFWIMAGAALLSRGRLGALLALAAAGELAAFGLGYLPAVTLSRLPGSAPAVVAVRTREPGATAMIAAASDVYPPDLSTLDRLRDARSYDLLESREWIARLSRCGYDESSRAFPGRLSAVQVDCLASEGVRYFLSRELSPGTTWIGGGEPPAVGAYELPGAAPARPPRGGPPRGALAGALLSLAAAVGAVYVARAAGFSHTERSWYPTKP